MCLSPKKHGIHVTCALMHNFRPAETWQGYLCWRQNNTWYERPAIRSTISIITYRSPPSVFILIKHRVKWETVVVLFYPPFVVYPIPEPWNYSCLTAPWGRLRKPLCVHNWQLWYSPRRKKGPSLGTMTSLGEELLVTVNKLQDLVFNTIGNDSLDLPQIVSYIRSS